MTESLESRVLLAGDTSLAWHNADMPMDTTGNGQIAPSDLLAVIKELNGPGARKLDASQPPIAKVDVNGDGFVSPSDSLGIIRHLNAANGEGDELVRMRLDVTSRDSLTSVSTLEPNQDFYLRFYTTDLADNPEGVFSAYIDVEYEAELADPETDQNGLVIDFTDDFRDGPSGTFNVNGDVEELDEIGAFNQRQPLDGSLEMLVLSVPMRTDSNVGELNFSGNPSDILPIHEVLVYGDDDLTPIDGDLILFENVTVQVQIPGAPTAFDDSYDGFEDTALAQDAAGGVLSNDSPASGLTVSLVSGPANGSVDLSSDGSFSYTPDPEFSGTDSFVYVATDGVVTSNEATVTLNVAEVNDAPTAVDDAYETTSETPLIRTAADGVLANDTDPDSPTRTVVVNDVEGPFNGQLDISPDGGFTYTPNIGFSGEDTFTYVATDGTSVSNRATVSIQVGTDPDAPEANPDDYEVVSGNDLIVSEDDGVLSNDTDPNGASLVASLVTTTSNGSLVLNENGSFTYTPDPGFIGTDAFEYRALNVAISSPTTTVSIDVLDSNLSDPVALPDEYGVSEDDTLTVSVASGVLANDSDADGDLLTASLVSGPLNGSLDLSANGAFVYTPDPDFNGSDSFTYEASDGTRGTQAVASIVVDPVQDAPVAEDDEYNVTPGETLFVLVQDGVLVNDVDVDGDPLTAQVEDEPVNGTLTLNANGSFEYTPNEGFEGLDSFSYLASDGVDTSPATVTLNVMPEATGPLVNIRLSATNLSGETIDEIDAGQSFLLHMFVADVGPEPVEGVFAAYADIEWQPSLAFVEGDLVYNVDYPNGQLGNTSTAGIVDDAGAFSGLDEGSMDEFLLLTVPMRATGDGDVTFSTNEADNPPFTNILLFDTLDVAVPTTNVAYGSTTLTVQGPTEPVAVPDSYEADNGSLDVSAAAGVLSNDVGIGSGDLTATLVSSTSNGVLDLSSDGSFTYSSDFGFIGEDVFQYQVVEDGIASNTTTVTITVGDPTPGSVAGWMYFDSNDNGNREGSEHGFGGVTITLSGTDIFGNDVQRQAVTNPDGSYLLPEVSAGVYTVVQETPAIVIDGKDTMDGVLSQTNDSFNVILAADQDITELNFGERGLRPQFIRSSALLSSRSPEGAGIGISPGGVSSWYCFDGGWDDVRDLEATLSEDGSTVTLSATNNNGQRVSGTFTTSSPSVRVLGDATNGYFVRLVGPSSSFPMTPAINPLAADTLFAV